MNKPNLKPYADLKARVREYEDKESGKMKGVYVKVGTLFSSPHHSHMFINIEAIPTGNKWDGAVSVFKRDDWVEPNDAEDDDLKPVTIDDIPF